MGFLLIFAPSAGFPKLGKTEKTPLAGFPKLGKNNKPNISNKKQ